MKIKDLVYQAKPGEAPPWYYGFAFYDYPMRFSIWYPIPFNWIIRYGREIYFWLRNAGNYNTAREKIYNDGYDKGLATGRKHMEDTVRFLEEMLDKKSVILEKD